MFSPASLRDSVNLFPNDIQSIHEWHVDVLYRIPLGFIMSSESKTYTQTREIKVILIQ